MSHTATDRRPGTPLRVLVVEDSLFFRGQLVRLLQDEGDIVVVGEAGDGIEAIRKVQTLRPDLVTMDIEMPVMDGIAAVREIMKIAPTAIMMLSALTRLGADATFAALEAGAADFIPKQSLSGDGSAAAARALRERVRQLARGGLRVGAVPRAPAANAAAAGFAERSLLVIGASTGGPALVSELLDAAAPDLPCAVLVVMHMPAGFTRYYAERTDRRCALTVAEAVDGAVLVPGRVWIAPGGSQTTIRRGGGLELDVREAASSDVYRPCIDLTLTSVAQTYRSRALAVIATGMGSDGAHGCRALRAAGGGIWAQDEASSAVFGMPAAVINAGLADEVVSAGELKRRLQQGR
jgi:two-component system chemotaxis response regulator CheB